MTRLVSIQVIYQWLTNNTWSVTRPLTPIHLFSHTEESISNVTSSIFFSYTYVRTPIQSTVIYFVRYPWCLATPHDEIHFTPFHPGTFGTIPETQNETDQPYDDVPRLICSFSKRDYKIFSVRPIRLYCVSLGAVLQEWTRSRSLLPPTSVHDRQVCCLHKVVIWIVPNDRLTYPTIFLSSGPIKVSNVRLVNPSILSGEWL